MGSGFLRVLGIHWCSIGARGKAACVSRAKLHTLRFCTLTLRVPNVVNAASWIVGELASVIATSRCNFPVTSFESELLISSALRIETRTSEPHSAAGSRPGHSTKPRWVIWSASWFRSGAWMIPCS